MNALQLTHAHRAAMPENQRDKIEFLEKEIRSCERQISFSGWLLLIALICIPISVFTGNRVIGFSVISLIVGYSIGIAGFIARQKRDDLKRAADSLRLIERLSLAMSEAAEISYGASDKIDPISMN